MADGEKLFNLIDEPWILVRKNSGETTEVSLLDALTHAHEYDALAGELPTQDVAILRLMLAVLYTVFTRYNADGSEREYVPDFDDMVDMWKEVWDSGYLPEQPIREYLDKCHERFWLFHPERPFYQANSAKKSKTYTAAKLNGAISESGNKLRLFSNRSSESKYHLSFSETARWLIHLNGFDDSAVKPARKSKENKDKEEKLPSPGVSWLGKLGLIWSVGSNLFQTLMLNFTFTDDVSEEWFINHPIWEEESPNEAERREINVPNNPAHLYTLQSRKVLLIRQGNYVTDYHILSGDFFKINNVFIEPMTMWEHIVKKNTETYIPKPHDKSRQIWKEFATIVCSRSDTIIKENHEPGVVNWAKRLKEYGYLSDSYMCRFEISSIKYGDKNSSFDDFCYDTLTFNADLLSQKGNIIRYNIITEIKLCEEFAQKLADFIERLMKASGLSGNDSNSKRIIELKKIDIKEQYYSRIDSAMRQWIASIDPLKLIIDDKRKEWRKQNYRIAVQLSNEIISKMCDKAFIGRSYEDKGKIKHFSIPEAKNDLISDIKKLYALKGDKGESN